MNNNKNNDTIIQFRDKDRGRSVKRWMAYQEKVLVKLTRGEVE